MRNTRIVHEKALYEKRSHNPKINYHAIDKNGRMQWCDCFPCIRFADRIVCCGNFWTRRYYDHRDQYKIRSRSKS